MNEALPQWVDSHCHLDFPGLAERLPQVLANMREHGVGYALCAGVTLERFPALLALAEQHAHIFAAVGVHPDTEEEGNEEPSAERLAMLAALAKVVAVGETGLDYYRLQGDLSWQRQRFVTHITAAKMARKPLIIHTRSAAADTLAILRSEEARAVGGVFHCFTESLEVARQALDLGFAIGISGIVTFKNAQTLKAVAAYVPLDRLLVETDAPYLAPVPYRGKTNEPAWVRFVAEEVARLRGMSHAALAEVTSENFFRIFSAAQRTH